LIVFITSSFQEKDEEEGVEGNDNKEQLADWKHIDGYRWRYSFELFLKRL